MKSLLAAACIISIVCGYIIGKSSSTSTEETQATLSKPTRHDRTPSRETRTRATGENALLDSILGGRSISEIPVADLAALIAKLSKYDPNMDALSRAKQSYQLQLLLAKLSTSDLADIASALNAESESKESENLAAVISALAEKDPDRALDWLSTQEENSTLYAVVLGAIAKDNPLTASALLRGALLDEKISGSQLWAASYLIGQSTAKLGVTPFITYLDSLPQQQQSNIAHNAFSNIPENERINCLDQLYQRNQDGRLKGINIESIFSNILIKDKAAATEWFARLPDSEEKNSLRTKAAISLFTSGDKESAEKWMKEALAASPGKEKQIIQDSMQNMAYMNPDGIGFFFQLLPENQNFTAKDLESYAISTLYSGTGSLTAYANAIRDPNEKALLIANILNKSAEPNYRNHRGLNSTDFEILSHKIAAMGFTGENATLVNSALEAAKNPAPATE